MAEPLSLALILLVAAALLALGGGRRFGAMLCASASALVLWTSSAPVASDVLRAALESQHPPRPIEEFPHADVIVVLGGGVMGVSPPRLRPEVKASGDRLLFAIALFHAGKAPKILVSGGAYPWQRERPNAHEMRDFLVELGVPAGAIEIEDRSLNTRENCLRAKELLPDDESRVLLVTSALHMPRALGACRAAGLLVTPASTDIEVLGEPDGGALRWLPDSEALDGTTRAIHELLGIAVYRARGWL